MEEVYKAEIVVKGKTWDTLWLIAKTIREGQKKELPFRIVIESGSVDTTISVAANIAALGVFVYHVIEYLRKKREQDKPLEITRFNRDVAYAYVLHHLRTVADVPRAELTSERRQSDGYYHFEFKETTRALERISVVRHIYKISSDFDVKYDRYQQ